MSVFAVVTRVGEYPGNHAAAMGDFYIELGNPGDDSKKIDPVTALSLRVPVFELGEILILDGESGREVSGHGRKPSKWDVEVEHFATVEEAIARARGVGDDDK